ncbi:hypothetical protein [Streptomyces sp. cg36]|uniref:hypothetical protein n=1 Tax=Streptomyces sp. cg36 TaxID=3238798 RepID=UPI0034E1CACB
MGLLNRLLGGTNDYRAPNATPRYREREAPQAKAARKTATARADRAARHRRNLPSDPDPFTGRTGGERSRWRW